MAKRNETAPSARKPTPKPARSKPAATKPARKPTGGKPANDGGEAPARKPRKPSSQPEPMPAVMMPPPPPRPPSETEVLLKNTGRVLLSALRGAWGYREDILGIGLLLLTAYFALAVYGPLFGLAQGSGPREGGASVLVALGEGLARWLGWGALLTPLVMGGVGAIMVARRFGTELRIDWLRLVVGEVALAAALGWTHLLLANLSARASSLPVVTVLQAPEFAARTYAGEGGGIVGWALALALAETLGPTLATWLLAGVVSLGLAIVAGFRLRHVWEALHRLQVTLGANELPPEPEPMPEIAMEFAGVARAAVDGPDGNEDEPEAAPHKARTTAVRTPGARTTHFTVDTEDGDEASVAASKPKRKRKAAVLLPSLELLKHDTAGRVDERVIKRYTGIIEQTLEDFGAPSKVVAHKIGPSVTQFAVEPGYLDDARTKKVRVSQIANLASDLALALAASKVRIQAPVPGTGYVGIEVPNEKVTLVGLRDILESKDFAKKARPLTLALGRDVAGSPVSADLAKMPHLLIAGTTGSGKSVAIISLIMCLVMNNPPERLRMVMIDPKKVELSRFEGLPHVLGRVEFDHDRITTTLRWVTREMDRRYKMLAEAGFRDIDSYNEGIDSKEAEKLPYIVVLIDELADLMMSTPEETERTVVRLAQMARAVGIHMVVATQRPSVDIVTGLIKANFPSRMSFAVASSIDSRVILDEVGAETLLGRGDMLFLAADASGPKRLQGVFMTDREVDEVVAFWREQWQQMALDASMPESSVPVEKSGISALPPMPPPSLANDYAPWDPMLARGQVLADKDDDLERAIELVKKYGTASASLLQRKLRVGYPRAARLMDELQQMGIVGDAVQGGKTRSVLIDDDADPINDAVEEILHRDDDE